MKTRGLETAIAKADPIDSDRLDRLDLEAMEAELLADLDDEQPASLATVAGVPSRRRPRRLALAFGGVALAAVAALVVALLGGGADRPTRAYAAELVRFAESTPLLLLEGPGWRVQNANQYRSREGIEGSMEFVTGKTIPYESIHVVAVGKRHGPLKFPKAERASGMFPPAVRQRRVELSWRPGSLTEAVSNQHESLHPHGERWVRLPVLGTTAEVDTRAESYVNQGGPGDREMVAFWREDGFVLELRAAVPDQASFEERLGWLTKVDSQTWLDAMPAKVVKAADHDAAVREMLQGIPVPGTFKPSRVPDEGLTTDRTQVGAKVTATVSCLWFRQWGEARRTGARGAELEAEKAMATSRHWRILREMKNEGSYLAESIWKLAAAMPSGMLDKGPHRWRLLPQAEALGCARLGLPVLPRKQKLQRERGAPLPPL
jgi:hypothetical protein